MAWFIRSVSTRIVAALATVCVIAAVVIVFNANSVPVAGLSADTTTSLPLKRGFASVIHRLDIWWFTLSEIAKHWLVGIGYGSQSYFLLMVRAKKLSCLDIIPSRLQGPTISSSIWRSMLGFRACCSLRGLSFGSFGEPLKNTARPTIGCQKPYLWDQLSAS